MSIICLAGKGESPLRPDNGHLHNWLYGFYAPKFKSRVVSNSLTGLTISLCSSGVCLLIYLSGWLPIENNTWFGVFALQTALYFVVRSRLLNTQSAASRDTEFGRF